MTVFTPSCLAIDTGVMARLAVCPVFPRIHPCVAWVAAWGHSIHVRVSSRISLLGAKCGEY